MPSLTVTEKEHWKDRITKKIDKKIEAIAAADPGLLERIQRQAHQRALCSLGLVEIQAELDTVASQTKDLEKREKRAHCAMLAAVRRVPIAEIEDPFYVGERLEVSQAIQKREAIHEEELLAENERGRDILRLRQEKDNLLDTIWLATSPTQVRQLWQQVIKLLGEEQTDLQKEALAIGGTETSA